MRVVHVSIGDSGGGAARAAFRLHRSLAEGGIDSQMIVRRKVSDDPSVVASSTLFEKALSAVAPRLDTLPIKLAGRRGNGAFSTGLVLGSASRRVRDTGADVTNLHWVGSGMLTIRAIGRMAGPVVWTLHDAWAFTGGCHLPLDCDRFVGECGACPELLSRRGSDLSRLIWRAKRRAWRDDGMVVVTPSQWLAGLARSSSLFCNRRIEVIPNGIDTTVYRPISKEMARHLLALPQGKSYLLFAAAGGAGNVLKGFAFLRDALGMLAQASKGEGLEVLVAGSSQLASVSSTGGVPVRYLGKLSDDLAMVIANAAADLVVVPSVVENFPNSIVEAFACGRPVVGFAVGGIPELIDDKRIGVLVRPFDIGDLANAIEWMLADGKRLDAMGRDARWHAEEYLSDRLQAARYASLYSSVVAEMRVASGLA